jgi:mRNA-degrading endonuclease RelE of RelBE toxin-antitoxin system
MPLTTLQPIHAPQRPSVLSDKMVTALRQGDYRILYAVDGRARVIRVYRIGHRRDIYRRP